MTFGRVFAVVTELDDAEGDSTVPIRIEVIFASEYR
jgi:hypothetical protein